MAKYTITMAVNETKTQLEALLPLYQGDWCPATFLYNRGEDYEHYEHEEARQFNIDTMKRVQLLRSQGIHLSNGMFKLENDDYYILVNRAIAKYRKLRSA